MKDERLYKAYAAVADSIFKQARLLDVLKEYRKEGWNIRDLVNDIWSAHKAGTVHLLSGASIRSWVKDERTIAKRLRQKVRESQRFGFMPRYMKWAKMRAE